MSTTKRGRPAKFPGLPTSRVMVTLPVPTLEKAEKKARGLFQGDLSLLVERALSVYLGQEGEAARLRDADVQGSRQFLAKAKAQLREKARQIDSRKRWLMKLRRERKNLRRENIVLRAVLLQRGFDVESILSEQKNRLLGSEPEAVFRTYIRGLYGLPEDAPILPPTESLSTRERLSLHLQDVFPGERTWDQLLSDFPDIPEELLFPALKRLVRAGAVGHRESRGADYYHWVPK